MKRFRGSLLLVLFLALYLMLQGVATGGQPLVQKILWESSAIAGEIAGEEQTEESPDGFTLYWPWLRDKVKDALGWALKFTD